MAIDWRDVGKLFENLPDGWYSTDDLLPKYNAWAEENGREVVGPSEFGGFLGREYKDAHTQKTRGRTSRRLNGRILNHRDWFRDPPHTDR